MRFKNGTAYKYPNCSKRVWTRPSSISTARRRSAGKPYGGPLAKPRPYEKLTTGNENKDRKNELILSPAAAGTGGSTLRPRSRLDLMRLPGGCGEARRKVLKQPARRRLFRFRQVADQERQLQL